MRAGSDFTSLFTKDNFTSRRTTGNNLYDPESLLTGAEVRLGFTYTNSHRDWPSEVDYLRAVHGDINVAIIPDLAPRAFNRVIDDSPDVRPIECIAPVCLEVPDSATPPNGETVLASIHANGETFDIVDRAFHGVRVKHSGYVEWPVIVPYTGVFRWAKYEFNGESSINTPHESIPDVVTAATESILRDRALAHVA